MNNEKKHHEYKIFFSTNEPDKFIDDDYPEKTEDCNNLATWVMLIFTALFLLFMIVAIAHLIITQIFF